MSFIREKKSPEEGLTLVCKKRFCMSAELILNAGDGVMKERDHSAGVLHLSMTQAVNGWGQMVPNVLYIDRLFSQLLPSSGSARWIEKCCPRPRGKQEERTTLHDKDEEEHNFSAEELEYEQELRTGVALKKLLRAWEEKEEATSSRRVALPRGTQQWVKQWCHVFFNIESIKSARQLERALFRRKLGKQQARKVVVLVRRMGRLLLGQLNSGG